MFSTVMPGEWTRAANLDAVIPHSYVNSRAHQAVIPMSQRMELTTSRSTTSEHSAMSWRRVQTTAWYVAESSGFYGWLTTRSELLVG